MIKKIILFLTLVGIISCEDLITPDLPTNEPILVVDAWINNLEKSQVIKLSKTQDYLDSSSPVPAVGANVEVIDEFGNVFSFIENKAGEYVWFPDEIVKTIGEIGTAFYLNIQFDGKNIISESRLLRTCCQQTNFKNIEVIVK